MSHAFALRNGSRPADEYRKLAREAASRAKNAVMIEDLGMMEAREGKFESAAGYFRQARSLYTRRDDILRVVLAEAESMSKQGDSKRALALIQNTMRMVSDGPTMNLLKKLEQDLGGAAAAPVSK